jgi:SET domain-containing protein
MKLSQKEIVHRAPFANVCRSRKNGQQSLEATRSFKCGELICSFYAGTVSDTPSYLTVQTGNNKHITLLPEFLQYINHSCVPNVFFDTKRMELVCLRDIKAGDEITFFYPSTEWEMAQPFLCQCGHPGCLQIIQGAAFLKEDVLNQHTLTAFIQKKLIKKSKVVTG